MNRSEIIGFLREQRYLPHPADAGLDRDLMEAIKCLRTMVPARSSKCLHENDKEHLDDTNVADIPLGKDRVIVDPFARDDNRTVFDSPTVRDTLLASMRDTKCKTELTGVNVDRIILDDPGELPPNFRQFLDEEGRIDCDFDVPRKPVGMPIPAAAYEMLLDKPRNVTVAIPPGHKQVTIPGYDQFGRPKSETIVVPNDWTSAHSIEVIASTSGKKSKAERRKNKKGRDLSTRP